jgi:hypothetical protein
MHEIFRNTVQGTKLAYLSKDKNTKTTTILYNRVKGGGMSEKLRRIQMSCMQEWSDLYDLAKQQPTTVDIDKICPTQLATHLRTISWTPVTEGDNIEGVTIPHPTHQFQLQYLSEDLKRTQLDGTRLGVWNQNSGEYMVFKMSTPTTCEAHTTLGPYAHYIGSTTREKKSGAPSPVQAAQRLVQLSSWLVNPQSQLRTYPEEAATSRTDIQLTLLKHLQKPSQEGQ